eukprot:scaffold9896_cov36-Prasinocladus_malaysianus.AAC.1
MAIRAAPAPNAFRYNLPTACALVPALLVLAGYGGQVVMGTFLVPHPLPNLHHTHSRSVPALISCSSGVMHHHFFC